MLKTVTFICTVLLQVSVAASAFNLYRTPGGDPVHWNTAEVEVVLDPSLSALGEMGTVERILQESFYKWQHDAGIPVQFLLVRGECREQADDDNNCIFACTDPHADCAPTQQNKGARAFLSVSPESGVIRDVDIVFNATDKEWETEEHDQCGRALNLAAVAIHEIGHALGIDHSEEPDARMYAKVRTDNDGELSLHSDDIAAAQTLYENFTPESEGDLSGCSVVAPGADTTPLGTLFFSAVLLGIAIIRRGRRETH